MHLRMQFVAGVTPTLAGEVLHLSHPQSDPTFRESNLKNVLQCFENYRQGRFLGTCLQDAERWAASISPAQPAA